MEKNVKVFSVCSREINPFEPLFVLCKEVYVSGFKFGLGDRVEPDSLPLHILHTHFSNGIVGTAEELEALGGVPIKLSNEDPLMPIAAFVTNPYENPSPTEVVVDESTPLFSVTALEELSGDDYRVKDLVDYADSFDLSVKHKGVSKSVVVDRIIEAAKVAGLLPE